MRPRRAKSAAGAQAPLAAGPPIPATVQGSQAAASSSSSSSWSLQEAPDNMGPGQTLRLGSGLLSRTRGGAAGELEDGSLIDRAPPQPHSRFLKQKPSSSHASLVAGQEAAHPATRPRPSAAFQGRTNAVLWKLAQIENKIQRRKARLGTLISPAVQQTLMDEESSWGKPRQDHKQGAEGLRHLKTEAQRKEAAVPDPDQSRDVPLGNRAGLGGEKEDTGHLREASSNNNKRQEGVPPSRPEWKPFLKSQVKMPPKTTPPSSRRSSPPGRSSLKRLLHTTTSPPSRNMPSHSLSSSINDSLARKASPKPHGRSLDEGSDVRSLDELFLAAADGPCSSGSDFQVNVCSLADLTLSMANQKEGLAEEATVMDMPGSLSTELEPEGFHAETPRAFKPPSTSVRETVALEEDPGETEISEQLSGSSAEGASCKQEIATSAEYMEDFDSLSEDGGQPSVSEGSQDGSDASLLSGLSSPASPRLPQVGSKRPLSARSVTTKEAAVQTNSSSCPPPRLINAAPIDWTAEGPVPTTSHMASTDSLQELTTSSPAMSALNDMLKQNLLLIQQFLESSRHLHLSFIALLEEEEFHYHTLEEAKKYIDHYKRPPLTLEQALHEMDEEKQVAAEIFAALGKDGWDRLEK